MKKSMVFLGVILVIVFHINVLAYHIIGLENFSKEKTYEEIQFADVQTSEWYFENIKSVYEYGIMAGNGDNTFNPSGNITIAETITLLSKIHSTYMFLSPNYEETNKDDPWYTVYVQYAKNKKLIEKKYADYNIACTRSEFAKIMAKAIDPIDFEQVNYVEEGAIPDIDKKDECYDAAYMLYRAGVLVGSDSEGTFYPDSNITRAEAATIVTRIIDKSLRRSVILTGNN